MNGSGVNVCAPSTDPTCGGQTHVGGWSGVNWYECVELAQRLYKSMGWYGGIFAGVSYATDIYNNAANLGMTTQANGSITSIVPGDMIVSAGSTYDGGAGHVAIVDSVDIANSKVNAVEQNSYNNQPRTSYGFSNKTLTRTDGATGPIMGLVHSPNDTLSGSSTSTAVWQWYLRSDDTTSGAAYTSFSYGAVATDHPVTGDWDGNGTYTPGIVRNVNGAWEWDLRNDNSDGGAFISYTFGLATDIPIVGKWGTSGISTPGVVRNVNGALVWYLRNNNDPSGGAFTSFSYGAAATDHVVVGDWTGDGITKAGLARNQNGSWVWYLRNNNDASGGAFVSFSYGAVATDTPEAGAWLGNGVFTPGLARSNNGVLTWYLRNNNDPSGGAFVSFDYGSATDIPIVGDWRGNGLSTPGVVRASS
ncbi:hypothetical protein ABH920_005688 [Catenulispora sp. EB89]|uniref:CHAP domain-containing protein n=1 Tax=Catenulispora sp. EB89 TaxID=3156257 RepID=UPI0035124D9C